MDCNDTIDNQIIGDQMWLFYINLSHVPILDMDKKYYWDGDAKAVHSVTENEY